MFWTRLASGVVLVILSIVTLYFGGLVTLGVTAVLSLIGIFELCRVYKIEKKAPAIAAYIWTILYYLLLGFDLQKWVMPLLIVYLLVVLAIYVFAFPKFHDKETMAAFFAFYYVSVMLSYVYLLRNLPDGGWFVILIFVCSWGNDTLAYCVGRLFGKHKMSPVLSPKKSVEGLFGGIIGAGLLGFIFGICFNHFHHEIPSFQWWMAAVGAIGALPAVIGDLAASAIKRNNEVKDYGKLIPGHGGVLDRFDSMIFTAPILFYLVSCVIEHVA